MYDIIVIGSGVSGLTCACILGKLGKKVLVIEKHDRPGGCLHTFRIHGFTFSSGNHYIGHLDDTCLKLIETCGSKAFKASGGETYICNGHKRCINNRLLWSEVFECEPSKVEYLADGMWWIAFIKLAPLWLAYVAWGFICIFRASIFKPYRNFVSIWSTMQEGDIGCEPIAMVGAAVSRHYMDGLMKLSPRFVYQTCKRIRKQKGKIILKSEVIKIKHDGVLLRDGTFIAGKKIISSIGAKGTSFLADIPELSFSVEQIGSNVTHKFVFLGLKHMVLPPGVIWIKEGSDYLFVSHDTQEKGIAVHLISETMSHDDMLSLFYKHYDIAQDKELFRDFATKFSVKKYLGRLSSYGLACKKERFSNFRHVRNLRPNTSMQNLFLTGQDILMPGIASALTSAMMTCRQVQEVTLLDTIMKNDIMDRI